MRGMRTAMRLSKLVRKAQDTTYFRVGFIHTILVVLWADLSAPGMWGGRCHVGFCPLADEMRRMRTAMRLSKVVRQAFTTTYYCVGFIHTILVASELICGRRACKEYAAMWSFAHRCM